MTRILFFLLFFFSAKLGIAQTDSAVMIIDRKSPVIKGENTAFPDAEEVWKKYLVANSNKKVLIDKNTPAGMYKLSVIFILSKDGSLSDIRCDDDPGFGMCQQAIRLVKKSKNWTPAEKGGKSINRYGKQLFTFLVDDKNIQYTTKEPYTFYAGEENMLEIKVNNVKDKKIKVTISEGTITKKGDGRYIVKVDKPGKMKITVFKKHNKRESIGTAEFDVVAPKTNS